MRKPNTLHTFFFFIKPSRMYLRIVVFVEVQVVFILRVLRVSRQTQRHAHPLEQSVALTSRLRTFCTVPEIPHNIFMLGLEMRWIGRTSWPDGSRSPYHHHHHHLLEVRWLQSLDRALCSSSTARLKDPQLKTLVFFFWTVHYESIGSRLTPLQQKLTSFW